MTGLFSYKNLVLYDMQGNDHGLLVKTIKKFLKSPFRPAGRVLTFDKHQICGAINRVTIYFGPTSFPALFPQKMGKTLGTRLTSDVSYVCGLHATRFVAKIYLGLTCKVNFSNTKNLGWFVILASLLDRGVEYINWLPPRTIVCFIELYFGAVQLSVVSQTELLERLWIKLMKLRWWSAVLFCLGIDQFG